MKYRPCFKHVVLRPVEVQTKITSSKFVLPEADAAEYSSWTIEDFSEDCQTLCKLPLAPYGKVVVVLHHMVKKIVFDEQEIWIVPENAIVLIEENR